MSDKNNNVMMNNDMNNNMNNDNDPKERMRKRVKKAAGIALCAVLAGGLAAGSFEGINTLTGWNSSTVEAASNKENTTLLQTKSKKKSSDKKSDDKEKSKDDSESKTKGSLDVSDIAAEGMKSVVSITTKSVQDVQNYLGYYGFGGSQGYTTQQEVEGSGSGIIVGKNDDNLLIATNYHVVSGADTVSVTCIDGETYAATVNGYDEDKDLAVVSVPLSDISDDTMDQIEVATIGSSDDLKVGEQVVAIGNALGYGQSVTTGIVSAKNRKMNDQGIEQDEDSDATNLIQTDAAINPGNSGGVLINMDGQVVGINNAKLEDTSVEGMGYAIPITTAKTILTDLMNAGSVSTKDAAFLGVVGRDINESYSSALGIPSGIYVSQVVSGSPAEKAGISAGDVIVKFEGNNVSTMSGLKEKLAIKKANTKVKITFKRANQSGTYEEKTVTVTLGKKSDFKNVTTDNSSDSSESDDSSNNGNSNGNSNNGNNNGNSGNSNGNSGNGGYGYDNGNGGNSSDGYMNPYDYFFGNNY